MKEQWSRKVFQKDEGPQAIAEANAGALAQVELLNKLIELEATDIEEAFADEQ